MPQFAGVVGTVLEDLRDEFRDDVHAAQHVTRRRVNAARRLVRPVARLLMPVALVTTLIWWPVSFATAVSTGDLGAHN